MLYICEYSNKLDLNQAICVSHTKEKNVYFEQNQEASNNKDSLK